MGNKAGLSDFECGVTRPADLISEIADLLGVLCTTISMVCRGCSEGEKMSSERQFYGCKCLDDARG